MGGDAVLVHAASVNEVSCCHDDTEDGYGPNGRAEFARQESFFLEDALKTL